VIPGLPLALTPGLPLGLTPRLPLGLTPGFPLGPQPYNPFALVASPKLGLRHSICTRMLWLKTWPINLVLISLVDDVYYGCSNFVYHMEAHRARRLPLADVRRIKAHDIKLWEHDEVCMHTAR